MVHHATPVLPSPAPETHRATLPRVPRTGPEARRWVRGLLAACPYLDDVDDAELADDAELITAELITAFLHEDRRDDFGLTLVIEPGRVHLAVVENYRPDGDPAPARRLDSPDRADPAAIEDRNHHRSLLTELTTHWGHNWQGRGGWHAMYAELDHSYLVTRS